MGLVDDDCRLELLTDRSNNCITAQGVMIAAPTHVCIRPLAQSCMLRKLRLLHLIADATMKHASYIEGPAQIHCHTYEFCVRAEAAHLLAVLQLTVGCPSMHQSFICLATCFFKGHAFR